MATSARSCAWRRKDFGGEYPLCGWSQNFLESPRIGYAPLESQTKRWAKESLIEVLFPTLFGERRCYEVTGQKHNELESGLSITDVSSSSNDVTTSAGHRDEYHARRIGLVHLDALPNRNPRNEVLCLT
jgi:hypothetical protein